jgi:hypothetical protein
MVAARQRVDANSSCPCGSGRKFKRCCGSPAARAERERHATMTWAAMLALVLAGAVATIFWMRGSGSSPPSVGTQAVQSGGPPGPAPPGKVWSVEHGHWHDIDPSSGLASEPGLGAGSHPAPPGPAPAGKVWSPEHGHWHDADGGGHP